MENAYGVNLEYGKVLPFWLLHAYTYNTGTLQGNAITVYMDCTYIFVYHPYTMDGY